MELGSSAAEERLEPISASADHPGFPSEEGEQQQPVPQHAAHSHPHGVHVGHHAHHNGLQHSHKSHLHRMSSIETARAANLHTMQLIRRLQEEAGVTTGADGHYWLADFLASLYLDASRVLPAFQLFNAPAPEGPSLPPAERELLGEDADDPRMLARLTRATRVFEDTVDGGVDAGAFYAEQHVRSRLQQQYAKHDLTRVTPHDSDVLMRQLRTQWQGLGRAGSYSLDLLEEWPESVDGQEEKVLVAEGRKYIITELEKRHAAIVIQRGFREFKAHCLVHGWPSDARLAGRPTTKGGRHAWKRADTMFRAMLLGRSFLEREDVKQLEWEKEHAFAQHKMSLADKRAQEAAQSLIEASKNLKHRLDVALAARDSSGAAMLEHLMFGEELALLAQLSHATTAEEIADIIRQRLALMAREQAAEEERQQQKKNAAAAAVAAAAAAASAAALRLEAKRNAPVARKGFGTLSARFKEDRPSLRNLGASAGNLNGSRNSSVSGAGSAAGAAPSKTLASLSVAFNSGSGRSWDMPEGSGGSSSQLPGSGGDASVAHVPGPQFHQAVPSRLGPERRYVTQYSVAQHGNGPHIEGGRWAPLPTAAAHVVQLSLGGQAEVEEVQLQRRGEGVQRQRWRAAANAVKSGRLQPLQQLQELLERQMGELGNGEAREGQQQGQEARQLGDEEQGQKKARDAGWRMAVQQRAARRRQESSETGEERAQESETAEGQQGEGGERAHMEEIGEEAERQGGEEGNEGEQQEGEAEKGTVQEDEDKEGDAGVGQKADPDGQCEDEHSYEATEGEEAVEGVDGAVAAAEPEAREQAELRLVLGALFVPLLEEALREVEDTIEIKKQAQQELEHEEQGGKRAGAGLGGLQDIVEDDGGEGQEEREEGQQQGRQQGLQEGRQEAQRQGLQQGQLEQKPHSYGEAASTQTLNGGGLLGAEASGEGSRPGAAAAAAAAATGAAAAVPGTSPWAAASGAPPTNPTQVVSGRRPVPPQAGPGSPAAAAWFEVDAVIAVAAPPAKGGAREGGKQGQEQAWGPGQEGWGGRERHGEGAWEPSSAQEEGREGGRQEEQTWEPSEGVLSKGGSAVPTSPRGQGQADPRFRRGGSKKGLVQHALVEDEPCCDQPQPGQLQGMVSKQQTAEQSAQPQQQQGTAVSGKFVQAPPPATRQGTRPDSSGRSVRFSETGSPGAGGGSSSGSVFVPSGAFPPSVPLSGRGPLNPVNQGKLRFSRQTHSEKQLRLQLPENACCPIVSSSGANAVCSPYGPAAVAAAAAVASAGAAAAGAPLSLPMLRTPHRVVPTTHALAVSMPTTPSGQAEGYAVLPSPPMGPPPALASRSSSKGKSSFKSVNLAGELAGDAGADGAGSGEEDGYLSSPHQQDFAFFEPGCALQRVSPSYDPRKRSSATSASAPGFALPGAAVGGGGGGAKAAAGGGIAWQPSSPTAMAGASAGHWSGPQATAAAAGSLTVTRLTRNSASAASAAAAAAAAGGRTPRRSAAGESGCGVYDLDDPALGMPAVAPRGRATSDAGGLLSQNARHGSPTKQSVHDPFQLPGVQATIAATIAPVPQLQAPSSPAKRVLFSRAAAGGSVGGLPAASSVGGLPGASSVGGLPAMGSLGELHAGNNMSWVPANGGVGLPAAPSVGWLPAAPSASGEHQRHPHSGDDPAACGPPSKEDSGTLYLPEDDRRKTADGSSSLAALHDHCGRPPPLTASKSAAARAVGGAWSPGPVSGRGQRVAGGGGGGAGPRHRAVSDCGNPGGALLPQSSELDEGGGSSGHHAPGGLRRESSGYTVASEPRRVTATSLLLEAKGGLVKAKSPQRMLVSVPATGHLRPVAWEQPGSSLHFDGFSLTSPAQTRSPHHLPSLVGGGSHAAGAVINPEEVERRASGLTALQRQSQGLLSALGSAGVGWGKVPQLARASPAGAPVNHA